MQIWASYFCQPSTILYKNVVMLWACINIYGIIMGIKIVENLHTTVIFERIRKLNQKYIQTHLSRSKVKHILNFPLSWISSFNWQKGLNSKIIFLVLYLIIYNPDTYLPSFLNIFSIIFFHLIHVREQFTMSIKLDLDNSMKIISKISVGNVSIVF